jgi:hypothetical protein
MTTTEILDWADAPMLAGPPANTALGAEMRRVWAAFARRGGVGIGSLAHTVMSERRSPVSGNGRSGSSRYVARSLIIVAASGHRRYTVVGLTPARSATIGIVTRSLPFSAISSSTAVRMALDTSAVRPPGRFAGCPEAMPHCRTRPRQISW